MKRLIQIGLLSCAVMLTACGDDVSDKQPSDVVKTETTDEVREQVKQHFLSDKEPTVKDATWTAPYMFKVGVVDDGSSRDGFAQYVCEVLRGDFKIADKQLMVEVIDIEKLVATNKWVELGKATCQ